MNRKDELLQDEEFGMEMGDINAVKQYELKDQKKDANEEKKKEK